MVKDSIFECEHTMYEIDCPTCGRVGFHLSRVGAEYVAEKHIEDTDHSPAVRPMEAE
jgi:4-hydroxy-3-methylbut-2-en-1-yl diphosphate synthase IspG/GcpE